MQGKEGYVRNAIRLTRTRNSRTLTFLCQRCTAYIEYLCVCRQNKEKYAQLEKSERKEISSFCSG